MKYAKYASDSAKGKLGRILYCKDLPQLNHIILDLKDSKASDKAGNPAEAVLLYIKIREFLFQLFVDDAQIIHMPPVVLDQADDLFFDISLGGGGGFFLNKVASMELYHLKITVI